jgi:hypothetical protein
MDYSKIGGKSRFKPFHPAYSEARHNEGVCAGANPVGHPNFDLDQASSHPAVRWNGSAHGLIHRGSNPHVG